MIALLLILLIANGGSGDVEEAVASQATQPQSVALGQRLTILLPRELSYDPLMYPEFASSGDQVAISLDGVIHNPPIAEGNGMIDMSTPENAAFSCRYAYARADGTAVIGLYAQQERHTIRAMLDDRSFRQRLFLRPEASPDLQLHATLYYGPYAIVLARYGEEPGDTMAMAFVQESGRWMRTNALLGDPIYDHVLKGFVLGRVGVAGGRGSIPAPTAPAGSAQPTGDMPPIMPIMP